jgi:hypothetical protein
MYRDAILVAVLLVAVVGFGTYAYMSSPSRGTITTFEACVSAGNPILGTNPRQCFADGKTYTEGEGSSNDIAASGLPGSVASQIKYNYTSGDQIKVTLPFPGAKTGSAFTVRGAAVLEWFVNEAFPIIVLNPEGVVLVEGTATGDFTKVSDGLVPYAGEIMLPATVKGPAILVVLKGTETGSIDEEHPYAMFPIEIDP